MPVPTTPRARTASTGQRTEPPTVFACKDHGAARDRWVRWVSHQISQGDQHLPGGGQHLRRGQGEPAEVRLAQEALGVGPAHAVGHAGHQRHAEAQEVRSSLRLPRLQDHQDPDEADEHPHDLARTDLVAPKEQQAEQHGGDGGGRVTDARERRADPLLPHREQAERQTAQEEAGHHQMPPRAPVPRQPAPRGGQQEHQNGPATDDAQGRDLKRRKGSQADLHQQEARSPDERQRGELDLPGNTRGLHGVRRTGNLVFRRSSRVGGHVMVNFLRSRSMPGPRPRPVVERCGPPKV